MSSFSLSIPAQLKKITDRLAQAANLDNLDKTISSRAPASTALSNTVWTAARANNLNAPLSGVATQSSANAVNTNVNAINANVDASLSTILSSIVGPRKIQLGIASNFTNEAVSTNERRYYQDVAITAVSSVTNCVVLVRGFGISTYNSAYSTPPRMTPMLGFLKNASSLRLECYRYTETHGLGFGVQPVTWIVMELQ